MSVTYITFGHSMEEAKSNVRNTHNSSLITHNSQSMFFCSQFSNTTSIQICDAST